MEQEERMGDEEPVMRMVFWDTVRPGMVIETPVYERGAAGEPDPLPEWVQVLDTRTAGGGGVVAIVERADGSCARAEFGPTHAVRVRVPLTGTPHA